MPHNFWQLIAATVACVSVGQDKECRFPTSAEKRATAERLFQEATTDIEDIDREIAEKTTQWEGIYRKFAVGFADVGFHVKGEGDTWEEAFKDADDRAEREKAEQAARRTRRAEHKS